MNRRAAVSLPTRRAGWFRLAAAVVLSAAAALGQADAVPAAAIHSVLDVLDAHFRDGDVDGYLAEFAPDHPGAHAQLRRQLVRSLGAGVPLRRVSAPVGDARRIAGRTVVRVRHEFRAADGSSDHVVVEDTMFALCARPGGSAVPTFCVEVPRDAPCAADGRFRCPPCNLEVGGVPGWLCVPLRADRALALDAATFYLIGTDVGCEVSVRVDERGSAGFAAPATAIAERLADGLRRLEPAARPGLATAWWPAAAASPPAPGCSGARLAVDLPAAGGAPGPERAVFHVAALGSLQHLLVVRGSRAGLDAHRAEVQALLDSYRLLDPGVPAGSAATLPLQHHTGGELRGAEYHNQRWGVRLRGPDGWRTEQRCGGAAFRVAWTGPSGGRLWLHGYAVPSGMARWCRETADAWFAELCAERGLAAAGAAAWSAAPDCGALSRSVTCAVPGGGSPLGPRQRLFRLVVRDDLLLVVDAAPACDDDWPALRGAIDSLRAP